MVFNDCPQETMRRDISSSAWGLPVHQALRSFIFTSSSCRASSAGNTRLFHATDSQFRSRHLSSPRMGFDGKSIVRFRIVRWSDIIRCVVFVRISFPDIGCLETEFHRTEQIAVYCIFR